MRISRDKLNKLAHTVADTLAEIDEVGFNEDRNTIRQEARKALETLLNQEAGIDTAARLKIASQCTLQERFLMVRGDKRNYKIHLGSGNILMEPNDQYLCIVPDSRARLNEEQMYLPFEGDRTLSIILSKAFLLAEDWKIKDPTITRQMAVR